MSYASGLTKCQSTFPISSHVVVDDQSTHRLRLRAEEHSRRHFARAVPPAEVQAESRSRVPDAAAPAVDAHADAGREHQPAAIEIRDAAFALPFLAVLQFVREHALCGSCRSASSRVSESTGTPLAILTGTARELGRPQGSIERQIARGETGRPIRVVSVPTQIAAVATMSSHEGSRRGGGIYSAPGRLKKTL